MLLFLSNKTWHGRKILPSCSFCFDMVELSVYRASHVYGDECMYSSSLVLELESAEPLRTVTSGV
jgi:hypothetical protein